MSGVESPQPAVCLGQPGLTRPAGQFSSSAGWWSDHFASDHEAPWRDPGLHRGSLLWTMDPGANRASKETSRPSLSPGGLADVHLLLLSAPLYALLLL